MIKRVQPDDAAEEGGASVPAGGSSVAAAGADRSAAAAGADSSAAAARADSGAAPDRAGVTRIHRAGTFDVLPAVDLRGGRVVRLRQGDFGRETVYDLNPVDVASGFADAGARWLHIVDLDGARDGARRQTATVERIVAGVGDRLACEVAGGLRTEASVDEVLAAGAARAVVGTAAVRDPDFVARLIDRFGSERIAVALDVRDGAAVGQGWVPGAAGRPAAVLLDALVARGVRTFIVTAIDRDGLLAGPDLELLGRLVAQSHASIIASGGVSSVADLLAVRERGCAGAIIGRALYEGRLELAAAVRAAAEMTRSG